MAVVGDDASDVEVRINALAARQDALNARLERLDIPRAPPTAPKARTFWDIYQMISPLLQALILAVLAYVLTGRVTNAIQREQLDLSGIKEMRELLVRLQGTKPEESSDRQAAAVTLAAFGRFAVGPLIHALDTAQREARLDTAEAVERALAMNGWSDPIPVCSALSRVIGDPAQSFHVETHRSAIDVLARANCRAQLPALKAYARQLAAGPPIEAVPRLQKIVDADTTVSPANVEKIRAALTRSIDILERQESP